MRAASGGALAVLLMLVAPALAGCLTGVDGLGGADADPAAAARAASHVVVAVIDSGINAYHEEFRSSAPEAFLHPSTYLEGYPADAVPLNLTFDAPDWASAVAADCEVWNGLEPQTLYWVPGTRIVGIWLDLGWDENTVDCAVGERPLKGLDTLAPHGSGAAGRAVGATTSLCPDCLVVMTQMGQNTFAMKWASEQPWIDVQTNSWAGFVPDVQPVIERRGPRALAREATEAQVVLAGSGNGVRSGGFDTPVGVVGASVGVGIPSYFTPGQGHAGPIIVGGHDNGELVLWPGTLPHVVADVEDHPSAAWQDFKGGIFNGTSGSTPFATSVFARILLEARLAVGDAGTGLRGDDLAVAGAGAALPAAGPLADGRLTRAEAESLFMRTALARPVEDPPFDGAIGCPPAECVSVSRGNNLAPWSTIPDGVPAYYFIGFGQVGTRSLDAALAVLRGEAELPERPQEDLLFGADAAARRALWEQP